jgi:hypothetical protein
MPGGIRVVIPARRRWFAILFLSVWLVGWAFGEVAVTRQLLFGSGAPPVFLLVWLSFWTVGGAFAFATLAWSLAGREVVSVERGLFAIRREVLGVGRTWEYDAGKVHNLRVSPAGFDPLGLSGSFRFWGLSGGPMAFDYGARTSRFGAGVDEAEAASIVSEIREWLPRTA